MESLNKLKSTEWTKYYSIYGLSLSHITSFTTYSHLVCHKNIFYLFTSMHAPLSLYVCWGLMQCLRKVRFYCFHTQFLWSYESKLMRKELYLLCSMNQAKNDKLSSFSKRTVTRLFMVQKLSCNSLKTGCFFPSH